MRPINHKKQRTTTFFQCFFKLQQNSTLGHYVARMRPTWAYLGAQGGPSWARRWVQVDSMLAPTWLKLAPIWANFRPMLPQVVRRSPEKAQVDLQTPVGIVFWALRTLQNQSFLIGKVRFWLKSAFAPKSARLDTRWPKLRPCWPKLASSWLLKWLLSPC